VEKPSPVQKEGAAAGNSAWEPTRQEKKKETKKTRLKREIVDPMKTTIRNIRSFDLINELKGRLKNRPRLPAHLLFRA